MAEPIDVRIDLQAYLNQAVRVAKLGDYVTAGMLIQAAEILREVTRPAPATNGTAEPSAGDAAIGGA